MNLIHFHVGSGQLAVLANWLLWSRSWSWSVCYGNVTEFGKDLRSTQNALARGLCNVIDMAHIYSILYYICIFRGTFTHRVKVQLLGPTRMYANKLWFDLYHCSRFMSSKSRALQPARPSFLALGTVRLGSGPSPFAIAMLLPICIMAHEMVYMCVCVLAWPT